MSAAVNEETGEVVEIKPIFNWPAGVHPAADLFPMIAPADFTAFVADIQVNGLREPIWLDRDGLLLDGRNRLAACQRLGIEPETRTYDGDEPTAHVISLNVRRRHLTPSQLACVANEALPMFEAEAKARQIAAGQTYGVGKVVADGPPPIDKAKARDAAGESVGVGGRSVGRAKRVQDADPDVYEQVKAGEKSLTAAEDEVVTRFKSSVMNKLDQAKTNNPPPDKSRDAVAERVAKAKEMAAQGYTSRQIAPAIGLSLQSFNNFKTRQGVDVPADKVIGNARHLDSNRIVTETVSTLEGLVMGVGLADVSELDPEQIKEWVDSFTDSIKALTKFRNQMNNQMKETTR